MDAPFIVAVCAVENRLRLNIFHRGKPKARDEDFQGAHWLFGVCCHHSLTTLAHKPQTLLLLACVVAFAAAIDTSEMTADNSEGMITLGDDDNRDEEGPVVLGTDKDEEGERAVELSEKLMDEAAEEDVHEPAKVRGPSRPVQGLLLRCEISCV